MEVVPLKQNTIDAGELKSYIESEIIIVCCTKNNSYSLIISKICFKNYNNGSSTKKI